MSKPEGNRLTPQEKLLLAFVRKKPLPTDLLSSGEALESNLGPMLEESAPGQPGRRLFAESAPSSGEVLRLEELERQVLLSIPSDDDRSGKEPDDAEFPCPFVIEELPHDYIASMAHEVGSKHPKRYQSFFDFIDIQMAEPDIRRESAELIESEAGPLLDAVGLEDWHSDEPARKARALRFLHRMAMTRALHEHAQEYLGIEGAKGSDRQHLGEQRNKYRAGFDDCATRLESLQREIADCASTLAGLIRLYDDDVSLIWNKLEDWFVEPTLLLPPTEYNKAHRKIYAEQFRMFNRLHHAEVVDRLSPSDEPDRLVGISAWLTELEQAVSPARPGGHPSHECSKALIRQLGILFERFHLIEFRYSSDKTSEEITDAQGVSEEGRRLAFIKTALPFFCSPMVGMLDESLFKKIRKLLSEE